MGKNHLGFIFCARPRRLFGSQFLSLLGSWQKRDLIFTLEAFLLIGALHSSVKSLCNSCLLAINCTHALKHLVRFLTAQTPNMGRRGEPRKRQGPVDNQDSPEHRHSTHSFIKHLIEHILCIRPWVNRHEKDIFLVLVFSVVRMSDS